MNDSALEALFVPFEHALALPEDGRVLFLRARDGARLREMARPGWICQQTFKPFADALSRSGLQVREPAAEEKFSLVLVLPPRQREEARALFARALQHAGNDGVVVASVTNLEGARSAQDDLGRLVGEVQHLSKHKCRVFWTSRAATVDHALQTQWLAADHARPILSGEYLSRPGLFAWDRIDPASALLAAQLPKSLAGRVADLGAGYGYLSCEILRRCAAVTAIDLYEAEARALEPARLNLERAAAERATPVATDVQWHDVSRGLPKRYDVIVSNPPFHQGRADSPELGRAFITAAADALQPNGSLWLVANRHLPYEALLATRFGEVQVLTEAKGFKVFKASGVRK